METAVQTVRIDLTSRPICGHWRWDTGIERECTDFACWIYDSGSDLGFLCDWCKETVCSFGGELNLARFCTRI